MNTIIKLIIAALLFGCLLDVPYGYFQFIRIACFIGFAYLAYQEFEEKKNIKGIVWAACAILLNPVIKIHFTRGVWNNIDLVIAIGLTICSLIELYLHYGKVNK
jgi:hypothetical protein